ncbi:MULTISPECIES: leucine-rich repeat domain-containing protein [unclassified Streptomyces]|uniref:leucine-rich repeat domain-containing protein n=1 Tax=unclassified Streptomyces TaxID=2593676 RepID=UPI0035DB2B7C
MDERERPRLFGNRWADAVGPGGEPDRDRCDCLDRRGGSNKAEVAFHPDRQDTSAPGWLHLLQLVDEAAADGREVFKPLVELSPAERRQIVTLPAGIAGLTEVRQLVLYGSNLVRIPPEIGAMTNLAEFSPYTSRRLHWLPYEITRCRKLRDSTVSTRALYGNFRYRPPFPVLRTVDDDWERTSVDPGRWGGGAVHACSVCAGPVPDHELRRRWISLAVATDVLPLLVNACSEDCLDALPAPAEGYASAPHLGGPGTVSTDTR